MAKKDKRDGAGDAKGAAAAKAAPTKTPKKGASTENGSAPATKDSVPATAPGAAEVPTSTAGEPGSGSTTTTTTPTPTPKAGKPDGRAVVRPAPRSVGAAVAAAVTEPGTPADSAPSDLATTTPVEALTTPAPPAARAAGAATPPSTALVRRGSAPETSRVPAADDVAEALLLPLRVARKVLPQRRTPVVLGVAALTLVGVLELPVAVGLGLGWEVLRRWAPADPPARERS